MCISGNGFVQVRVRATKKGSNKNTRSRTYAGINYSIKDLHKRFQVGSVPQRLGVLDWSGRRSSHGIPFLLRCTWDKNIVKGTLSFRSKTEYNVRPPKGRALVRVGDFLPEGNRRTKESSKGVRERVPLRLRRPSVGAGSGRGPGAIDWHLG